MKDGTIEQTGASRRDLLRGAVCTASSFLIVPRHVSGRHRLCRAERQSDDCLHRARTARSGVTMELLARPDVQIVAVCDCNNRARTMPSTATTLC